jgi:hypothetical protein
MPTNMIVSGADGSTTAGWSKPGDCPGTFVSGAALGGGFVANTLQYVATSDYVGSRFWASGGAQSPLFANDYTYSIQFKYRSSKPLRVSNRDTGIVTIDANTGDAINIQIWYYARGITWTTAVILFYSSLLAGEYFEVADIYIYLQYRETWQLNNGVLVFSA